MRPKRFVLSLLIIGWLLFLIFENAKLEPLYRRGDNPFSRYGRISGQWQNWDMFTVIPVRPTGIRLEAVRGSERLPLETVWPERHEALHIREETFFYGLRRLVHPHIATSYVGHALAETHARYGDADRIELVYQANAIRRLEEIDTANAALRPSVEVLELQLVRVDGGAVTPLPTVTRDDARWQAFVRANARGGDEDTEILAVLARAAQSACGERPADRIELRITSRRALAGETVPRSGRSLVAGSYRCPR
jgi:hypothetical protein